MEGMTIKTTKEEILEYVRTYPFVNEVERSGLVTDMAVWFDLKEAGYSDEQMKKWGW
jgi:hypothetical protein